MNQASQTLVCYVAHRKLPEGVLRSNGQMVLRVDGRYRIVIKPGPGGSWVLRTRLGDLPQEPQRRDAMLMRVLDLACGMVRTSAAACAVDQQEESLWLQQSVRSDVSMFELDEALERFVNVLPVWTSAVREE
jgi:hypothetical protein